MMYQVYINILLHVSLAFTPDLAKPKYNSTPVINSNSSGAPIVTDKQRNEQFFANKGMENENRPS